MRPADTSVPTAWTLTVIHLRLSLLPDTAAVLLS